MRFLLDTNIFIPAEPTSPADLEGGAPVVAEFLSLLSRGGHHSHIHPATLREIAGDKNEERRNLRELLAKKYPLLASPPALDADIVAALGQPQAGSHDEVDLTILSAVKAECVDYLVTDDGKLRTRARRIGLGDRVLSAAGAVTVLRGLFPTIPIPPPHVEPCLAHELSPTDPIFVSLEQDYDFRPWFAKVRREHRQAWVIRREGKYAGICIVNPENPSPYGLQGKTLKLCTFKISPDHQGLRYGELLLKTLFEYLWQNRYDNVFVEAYEKHAELVDLFEEFGFAEVGKNARGELALAKRMTPPSDEALSSLLFNIRFGPRHVKIDGAGAFVVPIKPRYHGLLFPEAEPQLQLVPESHPFGNSIRKAYLCHSRIQAVRPGSLLLFYRSEDQRAVTTVGVAEETLTSTNPDEIARFVARRTVYSYAEIKELAARPVLATQFRLARILKKPWPLSLIKSSGILKGVPQSFVGVRKESIPWILSQLAQ